MASRLPLLPVVVVMVMASLLALLLQSSSPAAAAEEPHIEMVNNNNKNKSSSSSKNDYCQYQITVRTSGWVLASGTDSTLTFYLYDHYGNSVYVSQDGSVWPWFESNRNDVLNFDGRCINQPCVLVVSTDGAGWQPDWLMSWLEVVITGGPAAVEPVTFYNGRPGADGGDESAVWLGPSNTQMQIDYC